MKYIAAIILILGIAGVALAGNLSFTGTATITNTPAYDFGAIGPEWVCQYSRTGIANITLAVQGRVTDTFTDWVNLTSTQTLTNTTTTDTADSWYVAITGKPVRYLRTHLISGADVGNTISGECYQVAR